MNGPESTTFEVKEAGCRLAVIGVGAFEQHSYHLPLETDHFFASKFSVEVARALDAFCLPSLPYSSSLEHRGFSGTVFMKPDTLKRIIWDIAESVSEWGIRYLAVLNFHGGNFILNPAIREWNMSRKLPRMMLADYFNGLSNRGENLHAGEIETSLMLHLAPEKVRAERAPDFVPSWAREDLTHFGVRGISPSGVWGHPSRASRDKGERWFEEGVRYLAGRIRELMGRFEELDGQAEG